MAIPLSIVPTPLSITPVPLTNAWMECLFTDEAGDAGATIRFLPRSSQPIEVKRYNKTLATTVTAGEEYKLWEMKLVRLSRRKASIAKARQSIASLLPRRMVG